MEFLRARQQGTIELLSSNDRVIKLWKTELKQKVARTACLVDGSNLWFPTREVVGEGFQAVEKNEYRGCHSYNINSLSLSPDGECFLSADDLRINMWSLEDSVEAYNVVDLKPTLIEELSEVITYVEYHPVRSDIFVFSSSKGYMRLCDLRMNSMSDRCSTTFQKEEDPSRRHFFTDIINSVSRARFSPVDPNYLFSRDYVSVHVWDVRFNRRPCRSFNVTDYLEKRLCEVYESETIFDKFDLAISPDSSRLLTGAYDSSAHVIDLNAETNCAIDVSFNEKRGHRVGLTRGYRGRRLTPVNERQPDMSQKVALCAWHPRENTIAVAKHNALFVYTERKDEQNSLATSAGSASPVVK
jgi:serine/threonine-protein phosphatase 2A regulatory subunit B